MVFEVPYNINHSVILNISGYGDKYMEALFFSGDDAKIGWSESWLLSRSVEKELCFL